MMMKQGKLTFWQDTRRTWLRVRTTKTRKPNRPLVLSPNISSRILWLPCCCSRALRICHALSSASWEQELHPNTLVWTQGVRARYRVVSFRPFVLTMIHALWGPRHRVLRPVALGENNFSLRANEILCQSAVVDLLDCLAFCVFPW